jgi:hypothetical protein
MPVNCGRHAGVVPVIMPCVTGSTVVMRVRVPIVVLIHLLMGFRV